MVKHQHLEMENFNSQHTPWKIPHQQLLRDHSAGVPERVKQEQPMVGNPRFSIVAAKC